MEASPCERAHDLPGAFDGGVGAFHGFDGYAGRIRNDHRLPDIVLREIAGYRASVVDVLEFLFAGSTLGENSGPGQQRLQQPGGLLQRDAFIRQNLRYSSEQESVLRVVSESRSFASLQSGRMLEKICLCFTCPAMMARRTPSR